MVSLKWCCCCLQPCSLFESLPSRFSLAIVLRDGLSVPPRWPQTWNPVLASVWLVLQALPPYSASDWCLKHYFGKVEGRGIYSDLCLVPLPADTQQTVVLLSVSPSVLTVVPVFAKYVFRLLLGSQR